MPVVVDTNLLVAANREAPQASMSCVGVCVARLRAIQLSGVLVLDDAWHILREYIAEARSSGQPGVGDAFLRWVLTNRANPERCHCVSITPHAEREFAEFPDDEALARFDRADRKFVAVHLAHPDHPPILNAVDADWWEH